MNTTRIAITISPDKDLNATVENLKRIGVTETSLEGNVLFGTVVNNLIGPLKTVEGIKDLTGEKEFRAGGSSTLPPTTPPPVPKVTSFP